MIFVSIFVSGALLMAQDAFCSAVSMEQRTGSYPKWGLNASFVLVSIVIKFTFIHNFGKLSLHFQIKIHAYTCISSIN